MTRRVLITGSGTGIGRSIAIKLAEDGFNLALHCNKNIAKATELSEQIRAMGRTVSVFSADISDELTTKQAIEKDIEQHGPYWGVVTNAGITADNLKPCIMPMIQLRDGGRIVSISSVSGVIGNRGQANYSASKAGIIAASKSLALELAKRKITVNSIAPGAIDTGMINDELKDRIVPLIPLGRLGKPEEIAAAVSFLFSDAASYITKQVININGGMC